MKWKIPGKIKIYEAMGSIVDDRVEIDGDSAKVSSSSGKKFYTVNYDPKEKAIMSNDNAAYWQGDLGYPAIAFLMEKKVVSFDKKLANLLKGIAWKDINQKFNNDFNMTIAYIFEKLTQEEISDLEDFTDEVTFELEDLGLEQLGKKVLPPKGY